MRSFRDRDYLETAEGFYFAVVGNIHPDDRVFAYLKYVPSEAGVWGSGTKRYDRVLSHYTMQGLAHTFRHLELHHPEYMFNSDVLNLRFSAVPHASIERHLLPERKLEQLLQSNQNDALETKTIRLVEELSRLGNVPIENFGVTGSMLMGTHQEFSDIDLLVYGRNQSLGVKGALLRLFEDNGDIQRLRGRALEEFVLERISLNNLTRHEAMELYQRKWNRGEAYGTVFSVHPVKIESEVSERYGSQRYRSVGLTEVMATVRDATDSMFMPATYAVDDVKWLRGKQTENVKEIVSYEGLYADIAREGEKIRAKGKLEEVTVVGTGQKYGIILIGSKEAMNSDSLTPL